MRGGIDDRISRRYRRCNLHHRSRTSLIFDIDNDVGAELLADLEAIDVACQTAHDDQVRTGVLREATTQAVSI